jgi:hypothetical protein
MINALTSVTEYMHLINGKETRQNHPLPDLLLQGEKGFKFGEDKGKVLLYAYSGNYRDSILGKGRDRFF